jgi:tetratricopeptide (TPR) repeat protein
MIGRWRRRADAASATGGMPGDAARPDESGPPIDASPIRSFEQAAALWPPPLDEPPDDGDALLGRRRGQAALTRGIVLARRRRFDAAQAAFADALRADAALELTDDPAFWRLERAAHLAAVAACRDAGRERAAMALEARLSVVYRPRPLPRLKPGGTG